MVASDLVHGSDGDSNTQYLFGESILSTGGNQYSQSLIREMSGSSIKPNKPVFFRARKQGKCLYCMIHTILVLMETAKNEDVFNDDTYDTCECASTCILDSMC